MKSDPVAMGLLYDYYGALLTERQRTCFELYHGQDYSLAEIAEEAGISRQGVRDAVARAEATLRRCEAQIGSVAREARMQQALADITAAAQALRASGDCAVQALAGEILRAAASVKE